MKEQALHFIYDWGRGDRAQSWSGTPYGLLTALGKQTNVKDCSLENSRKQEKRQALEALIYRLSRSDPFGVLTARQKAEQVNALNLKKGEPCLMFGEYLSEVIADSYCYQDLSVDYLYRLKHSHSSLASFSLPTNVRSLTLKRRWEAAQAFTKQCRGLLTMSRWLAEDYVQGTGLDAAKVHAVGGGCNIDPARVDPSRKEGIRFLFVGKDWERKNGPLTVKSFLRLQEKYPEAMLYIAGPANCPPEVRDQKNVHFLGRLHYDELVAYYNLCDYFVMPSRFEAYGIVFGEALIYGLPCIGKNCFAMPEFITHGENGLLIHHDEEQELFAAMEAMLLNGKAYKDTVASLQAHYLQTYSWDAVAQRIVSVMRADGYELPRR